MCAWSAVAAVGVLHLPIQEQMVSIQLLAPSPPAKDWEERRVVQVEQVGPLPAEM